GCLDTIATDHAPHTLEEKKQPYLSCPSGGPMIQHSLPAMLAEVAKGRISLPEMVEKMSHNPARLFGMEHRGYVREGYHADLAIVEFNSPWRVHREGILYQCGWSAFDGRMFPARVNTTIVGGQIAFSNGKPHVHSGAKAIVFER
ncbi:MAG: amidohydrolase family protein, partial [Flavobacteriales bacterium]|nr:amidohydrolase family protein [Flavobacteriales bacterium]